MIILYTVDVERFAGLNVHGFSYIKIFMEILLRCLSQKYSLFSIIKERCLYSWKNFSSTLENYEKCKSLAQWIFPCLRYTVWTIGVSHYQVHQVFMGHKSHISIQTINWYVYTGTYVHELLYNIAIICSKCMGTCVHVLLYNIAIIYTVTKCNKL